jgi:hypothetical protein
MGIYVAIVSLLVLCTLFVDKKHEDLFFYACCLILVLIACLRDSTVGNDHSVYIYQALGNDFRDEDRTSIEVVWGALNKIFKYFHSGSLFTVITSLLTMLPLFAYIKRESDLKLQSLFLFVIISFGFCFFMTGIRQSLATVIILWSFYFIVDKKFIQALVMFLLAIGIHASAIFVLAFLPLCLLNIRNFVFYILLIGSAVVGFIFRYNFFDVFQIFSQHFEFLSFYEFYSTYHADDVLNTNGLISVIVPQTIFAITSVKYGASKELYKKLFVFGVIGTNVFASMPMIGRYFMYFTILQVVLVPKVFQRSPLIIKMGILLTYIYMLMYFFLVIPEATGVDKYKFFF